MAELKRNGGIKRKEVTEMSRAKSFSGLLGNLKFIVTWKTWAVLVVFAVGVAVGMAL